MTLLKQIAASIREFKKDSLLTPFFVALEVLMETMIPMLMAYLIDKGIDAGDMSYILRIGLALLVMAAAALIFGALSGRYAARASAGLGKEFTP